MKRIIIGLFCLILFSSFVCAEDYVVTDSGIQINSPSVDVAGSIEIARLSADIENLTYEIESLKEANSQLLKTSDIKAVETEFFYLADQKMKEFIQSALMLLIIFEVFTFSIFAFLKAKRVL